MSREDFAALERRWFRQLTISTVVTTAGLAALLAGLGVWLHVRLLLFGAALIAAVFLIALISLVLASRGRLLLGAQLLAGAGVTHAIVQSYFFPFAAPALAVSLVLSVASVLPYVEGRPLRWLVASSVLSSVAVSSLPRLSPFGDVVPVSAQQAIAMTALAAVTILTALLLLQFSERSRSTRDAETLARIETERARRALEETSHRLRFALSAARIGIWDIDLATGELTSDDCCKAMFGLPPDDKLEYSLFLERVHADDRQRVHDFIQAALRQEGAGRYDVQYRTVPLQDGSERWIRSTGQTVVDGSRAIRLIGTAEDVSTAKWNEAELHAAKDKAEEASRAKDEFLAMLGHELRNPLAPILTAVELLRVRLGDAGAREREIIHRQVQNLVQLVDDMLDVARIRKGKLTIQKEAVYARQVVAKALDLVSPLLEQRRHRLEVDIRPPALVIMGDERRLVQVVNNLLTNAAKYTDPGGTISIAVTVDDDDDDILLRVRDSGKGIPAALLGHVFDLFVQGERTPDRSDGGLGLGLTIVRSIIERHGGSISAFSDGVGRGSEFVVTLPRAGATTPLVGLQSAVTPGPAGAVGRRVLIVDDNRDAAESLCALLSDSGHTCEVAFDGPSGLEALTKFDPHVVLLDLGLPQIDGYEMARQIRLLPGGSRRQIVAVTGYGQEQDRQRSSDAGFDGHLVKPVDLDHLLTMLWTADGGTDSLTQQGERHAENTNKSRQSG
jgi:signal transduction histidine kinase/FixJ family two-component response regulator